MADIKYVLLGGILLGTLTYSIGKVVGSILLERLSYSIEKGVERDEIKELEPQVQCMNACTDKLISTVDINNDGKPDRLYYNVGGKTLEYRLKD